MNIKSLSLTFIPQARNQFISPKNNENISLDSNAQDQTRVTISQAALDASNNTNLSQEKELTRIKSLDYKLRTTEEINFLFANDKTLVNIAEKRFREEGLTASEIEYDQKMRGGVIQTMQYLSDNEKALHDELVVKGNITAAHGICQIAFMRATCNHTASGLNGITYDPINTEITSANILNLFSHSVVDPSGDIQRSFQALAEYLQTRPIT